MAADATPLEDHPVILFDGVCNLCHWAVRFVIKRDPQGVFRFAAQQSDAGRALLAMADEPVIGASEASGGSGAAGSGESVVLIQRGIVYRRSTASLRIARRMRFPWPLMYGCIIVPRPLRDWGYDFIARNRYRWFGKQETCLLPSDDLRSRFLE